MARPRKLNPIRASIQDLGRLLGQELGAAINTAVSSVVAVAGKAAAKRGRPTSGSAVCAVPGCGRKRASWGLCSAHYQKARRLKMKAGKLDLATLAKDGRATRWSK